MIGLKEYVSGWAHTTTETAAVNWNARCSLDGVPIIELLQARGLRPSDLLPVRDLTGVFNCGRMQSKNR